MAAFATYAVAGNSAQGIRDGLSGAPHVWLIEAGGAIAALVAFQALWTRHYQRARIAAVTQVALIIFGWGAAQYPYLIRPELTIYNSASPANVLRSLNIAVAVGAIVLLPSLFLLLFIFKGARKSASRGVGATVEP
jgi:cytochrome d ubiquinol oxidase subunit II